MLAAHRASKEMIMIRAQVFALVGVASLMSVACTRKEDTATSETRTTSAEPIPTADPRNLPSAPADNAGMNDTAGAPLPAPAVDEKKDAGHVQAADDEKKDAGHVTAKPKVRARHGGTTTTTTDKPTPPATIDDDVGPGHIWTPDLPRKAKQAPAQGEPNSAGSHNIGQ
jgi:hypothetical protein